MDVPILAIVLYHLHLTGQMTNGMYQMFLYIFQLYGWFMNGLVGGGGRATEKYLLVKSFLLQRGGKKAQAVK